MRTACATLRRVKLAFHDTDILSRILADTSDTRDFLKLFPWIREDVGEDVGVGVGVVESQLYPISAAAELWSSSEIYISSLWVLVSRATSMPVNGQCSRSLAQEKTLQLRSPRGSLL